MRPLLALSALLLSIPAAAGPGPEPVPLPTPVVTPTPAPAPTGTVRVIYLVSADRQVDEKYKSAIAAAMVDIRDWYKKQLGGATFKLHSPVVEVAKSKEKAEWFKTNVNGPHADDYHYNNALAEVSRLLGAKHNDPSHIWVIYSDAPGDKGRGTSHVCMMPENDLLGLTGKHPTQPRKQRWVGGLGHELGHALTLPHPADTTKDADALMWAGFYTEYPDGKAYLTDADKAILMASPFIRK